MSDSPLQMRDLRFALFEHLNIEETTGLDQDTTEAFLEAGFNYVTEFLAPINAKGDEIGCTRHEDGSVTTAPGYMRALEQWREDGWGGMTHPEEFGGQELPPGHGVRHGRADHWLLLRLPQLHRPHARLREHAPPPRQPGAEGDLGQAPRVGRVAGHDVPDRERRGLRRRRLGHQGDPHRG